MSKVSMGGTDNFPQTIPRLITDSMTTPIKGVDAVTFINIASEDKEWSAHVHILNEWQNIERILRDIVQYARSGPFYPADMHVDLIGQYIKAIIRKELEAVKSGMPEKYTQADNHPFQTVSALAAHNDAITEMTEKLDTRMEAL